MTTMAYLENCVIVICVTILIVYFRNGWPCLMLAFITYK